MFCVKLLGMHKKNNKKTFKERVFICQNGKCMQYDAPTTLPRHYKLWWKRKQQHVLRVARMIDTGWDLGPGRIVWSTCGNKVCCNPEHLLEGTRGEYMQWKKLQGVKFGRPQITT